ncbi:MAG: hypothetical protein C4291_06295 [Candidatus Dadabacteria bacterium]
MAHSLLIVYEPLNILIDKRGYWEGYIDFYEKYWGGPTSPFGVWFGQEYETFRKVLSEHMGIDEEEIEDCFFMKDKEGYYITPLGSKAKSYILSSENYIPIEWFVPFRDEEREFFYTPWGFAGMHYDAKVNLGLKRLREADEIIRMAAEGRRKGWLPIFQRLDDIQVGIIELEKWLSGFDPSGYVLLNYGELSSFIHPYTLKNERSVKEIWDVLSLLEKGQIDKAQLTLNIMVEKWEDIRKKASGDVIKSTIQ